MSRRNLKDPRTPDQRRRDAIAARNRAWQGIREALPVSNVMITAKGERREVQHVR